MEVHIAIEIIRLILLNLEVKALIRSQSVCKKWRSLIQDPHFKLSYGGGKRVMVVARRSRSCLSVTSITDTAAIETLFQVSDNNPSLPNTFPPLNRWWSGVWCSCNGLVLFSVGQHILLWNPTIRRCTKVLELGLLNYTYYPDDVISGLCYVSSTGDYKAVVSVRADRTVRVADLKNKEWRQVSFPYHTNFGGDGVNFRNTLHWRVTCSERQVFTWKCEKIVYFEAESNEFKELPSPERQQSCYIVGLGIMDDCLCMARLLEETYEVEVLVMKKYGVKRSWVSQSVCHLRLKIQV